jgi:hypothetical protein
VNGLLAEVFQTGRELLDRHLLGITLADMAEKARRHLEPAPMYYL